MKQHFKWSFNFLGEYWIVFGLSWISGRSNCGIHFQPRPVHFSWIENSCYSDQRFVISVDYLCFDDDIFLLDHVFLFPSTRSSLKEKVTATSAQWYASTTSYSILNDDYSPVFSQGIFFSIYMYPFLLKFLWWDPFSWFIVANHYCFVNQWSSCLGGWPRLLAKKS